jgi:hypothetical protein
MSLEWMAIRGSGIIAYILLAGSTIWGLLITTRVLGRAVKAKPVVWFHESLAIASLLATGLHMYLLYNDDYSDFAYRELFVPGASPWRPLAVAWGVTAFHMLLIVTVSFYVKKWISQDAWRTIHFASFGTFLAAALHGMFSGTDTGHPAVTGMYVGTLAVVAMLVVIRVAQSAAPSPPARRKSAQRTVAEKPAREPETVG